MDLSLANTFCALAEFFLSVLLYKKIMNETVTPSDKKARLKYLFAVPVLFAGLLISNIWILKIIVLFFKVMAVVLFCDSSAKRKTVSVLCVECFWGISVVLAWSLGMKCALESSPELWTLLLPSAFSHIILLLLYVIVRPEKGLIPKIVLLQVGSLIIGFLFLNFSLEYKFYILSVVFLAVVPLFLVFTVFFKLSTEEKNKNEMKISFNQKITEMEYQYYKIAMENEKKTRRMYHDISNYIQTIYALLENGEQEKGLKLIEELNKTYAGLKQMTYCDNPVVNIILLTKREEAEKKGIETKITVRDSLENIEIADIDITTVICNLLDNAIRGCIYSDMAHPKMVVEIFKRNRYLVIRVLNSCDMQMQVENTESLKTTKTGNTTGGFGMSIISYTVKKYKGDFVVNANNGLFTATAIMFLN